MNVKKTEQIKKISYTLGFVACVALVAAACFYLKHEISTLSVKQVSSSEIVRLENKITHLEKILQNQMQKSSPINAKDIAFLNEQFNDLRKTNHEILDSKASLSSVMNLVERIDSLESQVKTLSAGTSTSALILTAAGLVENAAKKRTPFMYEASVLEELSRGTPMEKSAQIIAGLSIKGLPSRETLIDHFIKLYETTFMEPKETDVANAEPVVPLPEPLLDWKQKIKNKLASLIVIERIHTEDALDFHQTEDTPTDDIYRLVRDGDFETALLKMNADPKYQTEAFQIWAEDVRSEKVFDKQIEKIKALTLSVMKTEAFK